MSSILEELANIQEELGSFVAKANAPEVVNPVDALRNSAEEIGRAWSNSWIGYQAHVYYKDLMPPPPGHYFSSEWGFLDVINPGRTTGEWDLFDPDYIMNKIAEHAQHPNTDQAVEFSKIGKELFDEKRDQIVSILETARPQHNDEFLESLLKQAKELKILSATDLVNSLLPKQMMTRDSRASSQGLWTPPHVTVIANLFSFRSPVLIIEALAKIAQKALAHISRTTKSQSNIQMGGNKIFIGHGRSYIWKDLKDFIQTRLGLEWDEFNRVPVAGTTNIARLSEMLNSASIAFLVMTAEDEQPDGKIRARMNVVHEAGLFQGKLGFNKAIILLEEGCEEFSNIQGLGQIRFPKGNIKAAFEEIRLVLEQHSLLKS